MFFLICQLMVVSDLGLVSGQVLLMPSALAVVPPSLAPPLLATPLATALAPPLAPPLAPALAPPLATAPPLFPPGPPGPASGGHEGKAVEEMGLRVLDAVLKVGQAQLAKSLREGRQVRDGLLERPREDLLTRSGRVMGVLERNGISLADFFKNMDQVRAQLDREPGPSAESPELWVDKLRFEVLPEVVARVIGGAPAADGKKLSYRTTAQRQDSTAQRHWQAQEEAVIKETRLPEFQAVLYPPLATPLPALATPLPALAQAPAPPSVQTPYSSEPAQNAAGNRWDLQTGALLARVSADAAPEDSLAGRAEDYDVEDYTEDNQVGTTASALPLPTTTTTTTTTTAESPMERSFPIYHDDLHLTQPIPARKAYWQRMLEKNVEKDKKKRTDAQVQIDNDVDYAIYEVSHPADASAVRANKMRFLL